ncbi:MAG: adenylosuccinate lyase [Planctomycetales bacterium]|nr:adenylosuccinate lyase [Planctomycetales bacterium]
MSNDTYENPLVSRYASAAMTSLWSAQRKHSTWRRLWVMLAEAEAELGLDISDAQLDELRQHVDTIDFAAAAAYERKFRHDVMAHVHAYGDDCPAARAIIHLGATSCFVTDNADLILLREGLGLIRDRLVGVIDRLARFASEYRELPCLGFTHLQPAQPTTVGKRACLWAYDLVLDLETVELAIARLKARGVKGTTGTQASFLKLFGGDHDKVRRLDALVAEKMGFQSSYAVTGQTYPRKVDFDVLAALSAVAQSAHKAATDLRLLQSLKEIEEPFEQDQIGSSAMAYKRNPMRSERMCALSRFVIQTEGNAAATSATQWMERTLDDSANRRLSLPQAFLATDALLILYQNVTEGLVVYPRVIDRHLMDELPFMATENVMMAAVEAGGDRQQLHERIRVHSQAAARVVKEEGGQNDLIERLQGDEAFASVVWDTVLDPQQFTGRAAQQVDEFIADQVDPIRRRFPSVGGGPAEVSV